MPAVLTDQSLSEIDIANDYQYLSGRQFSSTNSSLDGHINSPLSSCSSSINACAGSGNKKIKCCGNKDAMKPVTCCNQKNNIMPNAVETKKSTIARIDRSLKRMGHGYLEAASNVDQTPIVGIFVNHFRINVVQALSLPTVRCHRI